MKVIVAEDDVISRRALVNSIEDLGYEVVESRNGEEAWQFLITERKRSSNGNDGIRLAILDWQMPGMNGLELCRKIREKSPIDPQRYIYVILLSGRDEQEDIIQGLSAGVDDYMLKPFDPTELRVRLENGERIIQTEEKRADLIHIDKTTGAWSREKIMYFLKEELDRGHRQEMPVGAVLIEVDHFRQSINKSEQSENNLLLKKITSCLKSTIRRYDKIGIYSRNQFLGVFPNCRKDHITLIGERLRRAVNQTTDPEYQDVTVSVGCTSSDFLPDCRVADLFEFSQKALQTAKKNGGDQVSFVGPGKN